MFTKLGRRMNECSGNFNKERENIRKYQIQVTELKNTLDGFDSRLNEAEERIGELEDRAMELTQSEQEKNEDSLRDLWDNTKQLTLTLKRSQKKRKLQKTLKK